MDAPMSDPVMRLRPEIGYALLLAGRLWEVSLIDVGFSRILIGPESVIKLVEHLGFVERQSVSSRVFQKQRTVRGHVKHREEPDLPGIPVAPFA